MPEHAESTAPAAPVHEAAAPHGPAATPAYGRATASAAPHDPAAAPVHDPAPALPPRPTDDGAEPSGEEYWNTHYGQRDQVWSGNPNPVLVREAGRLTPTTALDLGCGEGADAVWLAAQGWHVTATDISSLALERAAAAARASGVEWMIDWQQRDLQESFPPGPFGLVSAQFLQSPLELDRQRILQGAIAAVAPGGSLLVVGHAEFPRWAHHHPDVVLPSAAEVFESLGLDETTWIADIVADEPRAVTAPDGSAATLVDSVVLVRRR